MVCHLIKNSQFDCLSLKLFYLQASKSANYCAATNSNPTGCILLCDVALGNALELKKARYIKKLPIGTHSVKGLGKSSIFL